MQWNNHLAVQIGNSTKFGHVQNITRTDFRALRLTSYVTAVGFFFSKMFFFSPLFYYLLLHLARAFWNNAAEVTGICV